MRNFNWKYAIGEILIVITGITIAFSLNNWKEGKEAEVLRDKYLKSLKLDLEKDIEVLNDNINKLNTNIENIDIITPHLGNKQSRKDTIIRKFYSLAVMINFRPNDITYKSMINSGDFKLIDNFELKSTIEEHYSTYENIIQDYKRQENINKKYLADFFIYEIDYSEVRKGDFSFLDKKVLKNIVQSLRGTFNIKLISSKNGIESGKKLIEQIEKELNK